MTATHTQASTAYDVHPLISERWSPNAFDSRPISKKDLRSLFEAARRAPSSYNEQPWTYIVATKDEPEEFEKLLSCLVEGNQRWARSAPVLVLGLVRSNFARNGRPNRAAVHDLGLASANLTLEATARGISVHQMGGILPEKARELYRIPEGVEVRTALAIGYAADVNPGRFTDAPRRKPINEWVFSHEWGNPSALTMDAPGYATSPPVSSSTPIEPGTLA